MLRWVIEQVLLFLVPFAAFAGWLVVTRRNPLDIDHWSGHKFVLAVVGLLLTAAVLIYAGVSAERHAGAYVPPHVEGGRLVPGQFRSAP